MKLKQLSALCLAASALTAAPAMAFETGTSLPFAGKIETSASVALSTDYMWRGASQTDNEPAISGSFDVDTSSGLYAGAWASNVDGDDVHIEIDGYFGYANEIGDTGVGYDVGFMRYFFPGNDRDADWNEVYVGLTYSHFGLKVSHTEDFNATGEEATHFHLTFNHELPMGMHLHAGYAFYHFDDMDKTAGKLLGGTAMNFATAAAANIDDTLEDFGIGVSKDVAGFNLDLTYYNTLSEGEDLTELLNNGSDAKSDDRFVFTISKSL